MVIVGPRVSKGDEGYMESDWKQQVASGEVEEVGSSFIAFSSLGLIEERASHGSKAPNGIRA